MAVKLRLTRLGRKKRPFYRIIAVDSRKKRDGAYLEKLGYYHPLSDPPAVKVDPDKALKWLRVGAQPSPTVLSILRSEGIWLRFKMEKRGMTEQQIDEAMAKWFAEQAKPEPVAKLEVSEKDEAKPEPAEKVKTEAETEAEVSEEPADKKDKTETEAEPAAEAKPATEEEVKVEEEAPEKENPESGTEESKDTEAESEAKD